MSFFAKDLRELGVGFGLSASVTFIIFGVFWLGGFEWLEHHTYDLRIQWRGPSSISAPLILVVNDEGTRKHYGVRASHVSRQVYAQALHNLSQAGARLIVMDILFSDQGTDEEDVLLEEAMKRAGNVVLASYIGAEEYRMPLQRFNRHAMGQGFINVMPDADGVLRSVPFLGGHMSEGQLASILSLGAETTRLYFAGGENLPVEFLSPTKARIGPLNIPLVKGQVLINFAGPPGTFPALSLWRVATGDFPPDGIQDRIVLVGSNAASVHDFYPIPLSRKALGFWGTVQDNQPHAQMTGVEIHANAIYTLLEKQWINRSSVEQVFLFIGLLGILCCVLVLLYPQGELGVVVGTLVLLVGVFVLAIFLFWHHNYWLDLVPLITLINGHFALATAYQRYVVVRQKNHLRSMFSQFVSPEVVEGLWNQRHTLFVGHNIPPRQFFATILLIKFPNKAKVAQSIHPDLLLTWWTSYHNAISPVLSESKGLVGVWEQEGLRVYFGPPIPSQDPKLIERQAAEALNCACRVSQVVAEANNQWLGIGKGALPMDVWMSVFSGLVIAGSVGEDQNREYRVMGEAVEMTESMYQWALNQSGKFESSVILLAETTRALLQDSWETSRVGDLKAWNVNDTIGIYQLFPSSRSKEKV